MGGTSESTTTQNSQTNPWQPAQSTLTGILGQLNGYTGQTGINGAQTGALNTIESNANNASSTYSPQVQGITTNLLNGGGAMNYAPQYQQAYDAYKAQTNPLASNTNYDPMQTPGIGGQLQALTDNITQNVNGSFAAAGRDGSAYNQKALGQGLAAGLAPVLTSQYNQNVQNQQQAAGNLYNAGNTNATNQAGVNQQGLTNQQAGIGAIASGTDVQNMGANAALQAEAQRLGIPLQNLGMLANIGIPIAGLGSQSSGTSKTENQMSGVQQFMGITQGLGSLFGAGSGGGSTAGNMIKFLSDRRAKEDIDQVGTLFDGTPVYRYRYKGHAGFQIGLMAQEVLERTPEAVGQIGEYLAVDYKLATDNALKVS
jgi:hypothetical protein